jgi:3-methyladenine DNA glycosylase Tag
MRDFEEIVAIAANRKGGIAALEETLGRSRSLEPPAIAALSDNRVLAAMTRRVFHAGFSWKVVDSKWNAFEAAFDEFDPACCAAMSEERFDALLKDGGIVRNGAKIRSVQRNGHFVLDLAAQHGSAARFFAAWPDADYVDLLDLLKKRGSRLGGETGMHFVRSIGKPAFIATRDVVAALIREQVLTRPPSGKGDLLAMQKAFNRWSEETGRDLTALSRILAMSIGKTEAGDGQGY